MHIKYEAEILRYELMIGAITCEDVSDWAYKKIVQCDEAPSVLYDLSLGKKIGENETSRLLQSIKGDVEVSEIILLIYRDIF